MASVSHSGDAHRASDQPGCAGLGWQEVTSQRSAVDGPTQGDCPIPQALQARTPAGQSWCALRETRPRGPVGAAGRQSHSSLCQEAPGTAAMESGRARALSRADTLGSEARPGGRPGEPCPRPGSWRLLHGAGRGHGWAPLCPALASAQGKGLGGGRGGARAHACRRQPGAARLCLARSHPALAPWPCSAGAGHLEDRASHHPPTPPRPRPAAPTRGEVAWPSAGGGWLTRSGGAGALTSEGAGALASKPSQTSTDRQSPAPRSSCTASPCVRPSRLCWFTSSSRRPTRRRPSRPAAPAGLTCSNTGRDLRTGGPRAPCPPRGPGPHLGNKDAFVRGVTGVPRMALGAPSDADAQLLPGSFLDTKLPHAWGWRVPPHQQDQLQAGTEQGADRLLVCGLSHVLPVHCEDAVPDPKATAGSQAPWEHLWRRAGSGGPSTQRLARPFSHRDVQGPALPWK